MKQIIPEITAEAIVSCIEAISKKGVADAAYLSKYINHTPTYTKRAILMGEQLNLFLVKERAISLSQNCSAIMNRVNGNYEIVFKEALFNYKPFILLVEYITNGDKIDAAIRKTKTVFEIDADERIVFRTFNNFCKYLKLAGLSQDGVSVLFSHPITPINNINSIITSIQNSFEAQIFLSKKLGQNCFEYLTDAERKLLTDSLTKITQTPSNAIDDSAGAFESFLRRIGDGKSINLQNFNGIDELGQFLGSKNNQIILTEHRVMCSFFGTFRNPAIHKIHKTILEHWKIEPDSATEIILLMLTGMRSIHAYVFENKKLLL